MEWFDGRTYDAERDGERLKMQLARVWKLMFDQKWRTLEEISARTYGSEASVSARLRDFRKARFGGHVVDRRYVGNGVWEYRLEPRPQEEE